LCKRRESYNGKRKDDPAYSLFILGGISLGIRIFHVDAFADEPFRGNPAAVCILSRPAHDAWMQHVAREMNLSETAFLYPEEKGFRLRWFTPRVEVDLCGHATLASAHILWEMGYLPKKEKAQFHTRSGLLTAERKDQWIEMNFPATPESPANPPPNLTRILGVPPRYVGKNPFDYLIEVDSEETLRGMKPDFAALKTVPSRGFIVTSLASSSEYDFVSRFFGPAVGIDEDPVTGSAHCCLGPFWKKRLKKDKFRAYQASERGGTLNVRVEGDRVFISGQATTILEGELLASP
jgi:PhzF family phenazine biosynthesis protein